MSSCFLPCGYGSNQSSLAESSSSSSSTSSRLNENVRLEVEINRVTVAVLGARGVGKTSVVQQFMRSEFRDDYEASKSAETHYTSVVVNDRIYELKLVDYSGAVRFPLNSIQDWNDNRGASLRNASAYVIVYDAADETSFRFARSIRERIVRSRNVHDVPLIVVANKVDLLLNPHAASTAGGGGPGSAVVSTVFGDKLSGGNSRRELANIVRKQWKCTYLECSAKYNWRVFALFRELMKTVDGVNGAHKMAAGRMHDALRNNRCVIL